MSMTCPICKEKSKCRDTRMKEGFTYRRYQCLSDLHHKWTTVEVLVQTGSGRPIDTQKIMDGMLNSNTALKRLQDFKIKLAALLNDDSPT